MTETLQEKKEIDGADNLSGLGEKLEYPLPAGVDDSIVNRRQLATAFNVSENTIDSWRRAGMPVETEGGNGQSYEFKLSDCYNWRQKQIFLQKSKEEKADKSVEQLRLNLIGTGDEDDVNRGLDPKERKAILEAEIRQNELSKQRGNLIPKHEVEILLGELLARVRLGILGWPDRLERELSLNNVQLNRAIRLSDDLLSEMKRSVKKYVDQGSDDDYLEAAE